MKRPVIYLVNDAISLLAFSFMISTGTILKFILPPGRRGPQFQGGVDDNVSGLLGLARHDWGDIHFYVAVVFLASIILHVALHWRWIQAMTWGTRDNPKPTAVRAGLILAVSIVAAIIALPWVF